MLMVSNLLFMEICNAKPCPMSLREQIETLENISDGWFEWVDNNGIGRHLDEEVVNNANDFVKMLLDNGAPMPYLYPSVDGCVTAEWDGTSVVIKINKSGIELFDCDSRCF